MCFSALVRAKLEELERELGAHTVEHMWQKLYDDNSQDAKNFQYVAENNARIYPQVFAPVIWQKAEELVIEPMRYSAWLPIYLEGKRLTSYNARRDNLTSSFWKEAFAVGHGFIILTAFYEWVTVRDLIVVGKVSLKEVAEEFERQKIARKKKTLASGKVYKPSKTEKTAPIDRKILIAFRPNQDLPMFVPVIYNQDPRRQNPYKGFAIVTDDPPKEIQEAGHDRCPILLQKQAIKLWLNPQGKKYEEINKILDLKDTPFFHHSLEQAS